jgi:hypothetical protein
MKKALAALGFALVSSGVVAEVCKPLADYQVDRISFDKMPLDSAIGRLLVATPYKANVRNGGDVIVSAKDVSGNLGAVLESLGAASHFSVSAEKCALTVTVAAPARQEARAAGAPADGKTLWHIKVGDSYGDLLTRWGRSAGVQVHWEAPGLIAEGGATLNEKFEDAVAKVVEALNSEGASLRVLAYEEGLNRYIRIVERKN